MKICVIGSSHVGSLKLGWGLVRDQFPAHEIVFFGALGKTMQDLWPRQGKLVPQNPALAESLAHTSGGLKVIDPAAYDAIVVHGLALRLPRLRRGISKAVMQDVMGHVATIGLTVKIAKRLRKVTDKRLWIGTNPLEKAPGDAHEAGSFYPYEVLVAELQRCFPVPDVTFLRQPPETIGPDLRAPERFGSGSVKLLSGMAGREAVEVNPDSEVLHMNAEFGRLWMLQNVPLITEPVTA